MDPIETELTRHTSHPQAVRRTVSPVSDHGSSERIECSTCGTDVTVGVDFTDGAGRLWIKRRP